MFYKYIILKHKINGDKIIPIYIYKIENLNLLYYIEI